MFRGYYIRMDIQLRCRHCLQYGFFFFQYLTLPALTRTIRILETQGLLQPRNEAIVRLQGISSVQCSRY